MGTPKKPPSQRNFPDKDNKQKGKAMGLSYVKQILERPLYIDDGNSLAEI